MQVEIINIVPPVSKGSYAQLEAVYRKDGKVEGKKFFDFKHKDVFDALVAAKPGEFYEVETAKEAGKDGKEYWQWVSITTSSGEASSATGKSARSPAVPASSGRNAGTTTGRVTGSNYETPDERAARQRYIVRQSAITAAIALLTHNSPKGVVTSEDVLNQALEFYNFVFTEPPVGTEAATKAIMDMDNDIPE